MDAQRWLVDLQHLLARGDPAVLVTVAHVEGPAPRESGARMIVTRDATRHTVGGGYLELRAIEIARQLLREGARTPRRLQRLTPEPEDGALGASVVSLAFERLSIADLGWVSSLLKRLGQAQASLRSVDLGSADPVMLSDTETGVAAADCLLWDTAGTTDGTGPLLTETIAPIDFHIMLFGAGHVGNALVQVLATLDCRVSWIDPRKAQFPRQLPENVKAVLADDPLTQVAAAPPGAYFVVATSSHILDNDLVERIVLRADYAYLGVIGSRTKRAGLEHRLAARGIDPIQIARIHCPIGIDSIRDKAPQSIAVSVAAQLLSVRDHPHHFPHAS
ncbi:MAG: xanthine dehydrogenase accessory protein XdhC [Janthinobacterium lividum]